jgi:hypothetical protein
MVVVTNTSKKKYASVNTKTGKTIGLSSYTVTNSKGEKITKYNEGTTYVNTPKEYTHKEQITTKSGDVGDYLNTIPIEVKETPKADVNSIINSNRQRLEKKEVFNINQVNPISIASRNTIQPIRNNGEIIGYGDTLRQQSVLLRPNQTISNKEIQNTEYNRAIELNKQETAQKEAEKENTILIEPNVSPNFYKTSGVMSVNKGNMVYSLPKENKIMTNVKDTWKGFTFTRVENPYNNYYAFGNVVGLASFGIGEGIGFTSAKLAYNSPKLFGATVKTLQVLDKPYVKYPLLGVYGGVESFNAYQGYKEEGSLGVARVGFNVVKDISFLYGVGKGFEGGVSQAIKDTKYYTIGQASFKTTNQKNVFESQGKVTGNVVEIYNNKVRRNIPFIGKIASEGKINKPYLSVSQEVSTEHGLKFMETNFQNTQGTSTNIINIGKQKSSWFPRARKVYEFQSYKEPRRKIVANIEFKRVFKPNSAYSSDAFISNQRTSNIIMEDTKLGMLGRGRSLISTKRKVDININKDFAESNYDFLIGDKKTTSWGNVNIKNDVGEGFYNFKDIAKSKVNNVKTNVGKSANTKIITEQKASLFTKQVNDFDVALKSQMSYKQINFKPRPISLMNKNVQTQEFKQVFQPQKSSLMNEKVSFSSLKVQTFMSKPKYDNISSSLSVLRMNNKSKQNNRSLFGSINQYDTLIDNTNKYDTKQAQKTDTLLKQQQITKQVLKKNRTMFDFNVKPPKVEVGFGVGGLARLKSPKKSFNNVYKQPKFSKKKKNDYAVYVLPDLYSVNITEIKTEKEAITPRLTGKVRNQAERVFRGWGGQYIPTEQIRTGKVKY